MEEIMIPGSLRLEVVRGDLNDLMRRDQDNRATIQHLRKLLNDKDQAIAELEARLAEDEPAEPVSDKEARHPATGAKRATAAKGPKTDTAVR